jgi:hypothetical protein
MYLILLVPVLGLCTGVANGDGFLQDPGPDGIVSMEAEKFDKNTPQGGHTWDFITSPAGFSGAGAMQAMPNTGAGPNAAADYLANSPRLDFKVIFEKAGTHYIWVRAYAPDEAAQPSGNNDSLHAGLNNQAIATSDRISGFGASYTWTNTAYQDPERIMFDVPSAGPHTVNIWMREDGAIVDKIVLTTNPNYTPTGNGPPESQRGVQLKAYAPDPPDGAENITSALFQWTPGETAAQHDVYVGTSPALGPADFQIRQPSKFYYYTPGLASATTYYWRIDEVEADGTTTHTGNVWSFSTPSLIAYDPDPLDGAKFVSTEAQLSWTAGFKAVLHDIYFGTDETQVADGTGDTFKAMLPLTSFDPGALAKGTTYYWRIDEIEADMTTKHKGDLWSFSTIPDIPVSDPDLLLWWKFDEGTGMTAVDWSGHDHHGTLEGNPQWVAGTVGGALEFGGDGDRVVDEDAENYLNGLSAITVAMWIKSDVVGTDKGFIDGEDPDGNDNVVTMRYDAAGASYSGTNVAKMAVTHQARAVSSNWRVPATFRPPSGNMWR